MAIIRKIEIENFRCLKKLSWAPSAGINCIIGPGDSGKSAVLDAIDFCLGARRNLQITDADFYELNVEQPIKIDISLGDLSDPLKAFEPYGLYLRGFDASTATLVDEPEAGKETVVTLSLTVEKDLEPQWGMTSERAKSQGQQRNLSWDDRSAVSPTRLGSYSEHHLSWRRGSVLNRISDERAETSAALLEASRIMRSTFGDHANEQLKDALDQVAATASELGVPIGSPAQALLDLNSVSVSGGTISLHDASGIPLKGLGLGSSRLLIVGLQRKASAGSSIILVDELEHGLEPHRVIRLLDTLGAKQTPPPVQAFITTHSPAAVRELSAKQLFRLRRLADAHDMRCIGATDEVQGTIRMFPEALLAPSVIVCEGATEVGFLRGFDQYRISQNKTAIAARGVGLVDGGGTNTFMRANAFASLGYDTAVLRDSDVVINDELEKKFAAAGDIFAWTKGRAIEDELFFSVSVDALGQLIDKAIELRDESIIDSQIKTASGNSLDLAAVRAELATGEISDNTCEVLINAAKRGSGWFKSISAMTEVARDIVAPDLQSTTEDFRARIRVIFDWIDDV